MKYILPVMFLLVSCVSENEKIVREHLEKNMKISSSNLEIESIEFGEKRKPSTEDEKAAIMLLGLKDTTTFPMKVTFKSKANCVAVADAIKSSIFQEKKVNCRPIEEGKEPNTKYVRAYKMSGFRQIADYAEGKILKSGETFSATGELIFLTGMDDKQKTESYFQKLD